LTIAKYILSNYIGLTEKINGGNSPTVLGWIKQFFKTVSNTSAIPWCSIGMIEAAQALNLPCEKQTPAAISWATWGKAIKPEEINIEKNQVIVFTRKGGNHVASPIRYSSAKGLIYCVGFNQGDSCSVQPFDAKTVVAIRELP
jgi:uncharacterized protein (TIGR02594 family)